MDDNALLDAAAIDVPCLRQAGQHGSGQMSKTGQRTIAQIRRKSLFVIGFLALAVLGSGQAAAVPCGTGRAASGSSTEIASLQRQIAANRAFGAKHGCDADASSFACREISGRVQQAAERLASLRGSETPACQTVVEKERPSVRRTTAVASAAALSAPTVKIETMCVRLSDGYYFPTPNSGYSTAGDIEKINIQCRYICEDAAMDIYRMSSPERNADDMISLTTGKRYSELPTARTYRLQTKARSCDMNRFYRTVLAKAPVPAEQMAAITYDTSTALFANVALRGTQGIAMAKPDPVASRIRVVIPAAPAN